MFTVVINAVSHNTGLIHEGRDVIRDVFFNDRKTVCRINQFSLIRFTEFVESSIDDVLTARFKVFVAASRVKSDVDDAVPVSYIAWVTREDLSLDVEREIVEQ